MLHESLTYEIRGACITIRKMLGSHHKERVYHNALKQELSRLQISFVHEPRIDVYYPPTGAKLGTYQPDFLIEGKVLVEVKAVFPLPSNFESQIFDYVKNSKYELILFVNFSGPRLYIKRLIFTNDRKPFLEKPFALTADP